MANKYERAAEEAMVKLIEGVDDYRETLQGHARHMREVPADSYDSMYSDPTMAAQSRLVSLLRAAVRCEVKCVLRELRDAKTK